MNEILENNPELSDRLDKARKNIGVYKACLTHERKKYHIALKEVFDIMRHDGFDTPSEAEEVILAMQSDYQERQVEYTKFKENNKMYKKAWCGSSRMKY